MSRIDSDANALLPLSPAVFHLLLALADGPLHGYAIAKAVAEHTGDSLRLGPGTLYGTLTRMAEAALVRESGRESKEHARRRTYELTPLGRAAAKAEARRLVELVGVARKKSLLGRAR